MNSWLLNHRPSSILTMPLIFIFGFLYLTCLNPLKFPLSSFSGRLTLTSILIPIPWPVASLLKIMSVSWAQTGCATLPHQCLFDTCKLLGHCLYIQFPIVVLGCHRAFLSSSFVEAPAHGRKYGECKEKNTIAIISS